MDYQEEDYEAARMLKSLSSSYSGPSPVSNQHQGHQQHYQYHPNQYETSNSSIRRRCVDEWSRRASPMVDDNGQFLEPTTDDEDDVDIRNMSDWDSADESGDDFDNPSGRKRRSTNLHRYKPKNAAGQFISAKSSRGVDLLRTATSSSLGISERRDSNGSIITAASSPESLSLATVGNARDGIPRWVCPGCGKIYSIQSKRSWTNHMIACTGDVPPPVKKRKRRGT